MGQNRNWTAEEETYLAEHWGHITIAGLCKALNRSKNAILVRVHRIGLPPYYESGDYVTVNALCNVLRGTSFNTYQMKSWVRDRDFPVHNKRRGSRTARVVYLDEFWEWAEKNRSFLDFSKMEPLALGREPEWVAEQRHKDFHAHALQRKDPWSAEDDSRLRALLKLHRYGYVELSEILNRSEGAIQRRCNDLGLKERPVKADNHGEAAKWTAEMLDALADGIRHGDSYQAIGRKIGKSEKAVRGKTYQTYITENADKVRVMLGNGTWGTGAPMPTVNQGAYMSGYKTDVRANLSALVGVLKYRMNELGFDPYFQRHMCLNWSPTDGCTAGCTNCDECTEFCRVPPQYCVRCGVTFYERAKNKYCADCRTARKKKAQRHWARVNSMKRTGENF